MEKPPEGPGAKIERMAFDFGSATQKGENYPENNDAYFTLEASQAGGVFDGVGSKRNGREAALIAQKAVLQEIIKISEVTLQEKCEKVLRSANVAILEAKKMDSNLNRMATTGTIVIVRSSSESAYAAAGDTRAYIVKGEGGIKQLTTDEISWLNKNNITNWLGDEEFVPQSGTFSLEKGDRLIIVSDGIYKAVPDEQIVEIALSTGSAQELADDLVVVATGQEGKHSDDKTAVVIFAK